jgi:thiol-disulfide isomerase/thioredoxin
MKTAIRRLLPAARRLSAVRLLSARLLSVALVSLTAGILLSGCIGSPETTTGASNESDSGAGQSSGSDGAFGPEGTNAPIPYAGAIGEGVIAPDFSYTTTDGASSQLSTHRGSVVLMNLWASWCGPCVAEMPDIDQLRQQNPELVVLAINVSEDPADARDYIQTTGYDFTWILDENGEIGSLYPTDGIPYTIIIDKAGTISSIYLGSPRNPLETYGEALQKAGI